MIKEIICWYCNKPIADYKRLEWSISGISKFCPNCNVTYHMFSLNMIYNPDKDFNFILTPKDYCVTNIIIDFNGFQANIDLRFDEVKIIKNNKIAFYMPAQHILHLAPKFLESKILKLLPFI